ncbi:unnamed protein product [Lampetra fluviatilis]
MGAEMTAHGANDDDDDDDDDGDDDDDDDDDDCLLGVKILLIFVTVSWAESLASRAQFDFCDLNMRFEIFLSRMTHINTLQEACLAEIVDGLNHFRDFFFGNNCSESCDTLKSIRDIFLNSNIFHPTKAQSPEAARPPPAAPPRSLEGGLLDCGVFHLRLYVANVHRHAMSRGHAGACRRRDGVAVVAESATRTPGGVVTETPRRRRKKQRGRGGRKQRRGKKERRRGKATATGDDAAGVERGCGSTEMTSVLRREGPPPSLETRQQQQQLQVGRCSPHEPPPGNPIPRQPPRCRQAKDVVSQIEPRPRVSTPAVDDRAQDAGGICRCAATGPHFQQRATHIAGMHNAPSSLSLSCTTCVLTLSQSNRHESEAGTGRRSPQGVD